MQASPATEEAQRPDMDPRQHGEILIRAGVALRKSQGEMGQLLGVSRRTISRWTSRGTTFIPSQARDLAAALLPVDRALAVRAAALHGETLVSLGLEKPPPPPAPAVPAEPPGHLVDAVVCAAAEALDASPRAVRPALLAAFRRARELALKVEHVERALDPAKKKGEPRGGGAPK
jgi:transcriptional regulator with XRE-family HTH domain